MAAQADLGDHEEKGFFGNLWDAISDPFCGGERPKGKGSSQPPSLQPEETPEDRRRRKLLKGDWKKLDSRLHALQRLVQDVGAGGNCLFLALSDQLYQDNGKQHKQVRKTLVDWLEKNSEKYKPLETQQEVNLRDYVTYTEDMPDWKSYCKIMRKDGTWGDHLCLMAAANAFNSRVCIFSTVDDGRDVVILGSEKLPSGSPALELGHLPEWHYCSVRAALSLPDAGAPPLILEEKSPPNSPSDGKSDGKEEPKAAHRGTFTIDSSASLAMGDGDPDLKLVEPSNHVPSGHGITRRRQSNEANPLKKVGGAERLTIAQVTNGRASVGTSPTLSPKEKANRFNT